MKIIGHKLFKMTVLLRMMTQKMTMRKESGLLRRVDMLNTKINLIEVHRNKAELNCQQPKRDNLMQKNFYDYLMKA
jgi:hypothetical protein